MMNFYYDPILGLQYNYLDELFIIDLDSIPNFDIEMWMKYMKQIKISIIESEPYVEIIGQITQYKI